jgi:hypothetical protein
VAEVPERLKRNGRGEDQNFEPDERLFRRYRQEDFQGGQFSSVGLSFSSPQSVNREKYSEPADVLISDGDVYRRWGVLAFAVRDLPPQFPPEQPKYSFFPKHTPEENNYAHTEIWCDTLPPSGGYRKPTSDQIKKLFRAFMSQRVRIVVPADQDPSVPESAPDPG